MRRLRRITVVLGLAGAAVAAVRRFLEPADRGAESPVDRPPPSTAPTGTQATTPTSTRTAPTRPAASESAWSEPNEDGTCPPGYPVKAKLNSGIFHVSGQRHYDRLVPDRCYASAEAAEGDGLRAARQ